MLFWIFIGSDLSLIQLIHLFLQPLVQDDLLVFGILVLVHNLFLDGHVDRGFHRVTLRIWLVNTRVIGLTLGLAQINFVWLTSLCVTIIVLMVDVKNKRIIMTVLLNHFPLGLLFQHLFHQIGWLLALLRNGLIWAAFGVKLEFHFEH